VVTGVLRKSPSGWAEPSAELREVSKLFGSTRALSGVSLELRPGEVHALVGENGAGKSTLIRILSGVYGDFTGELRVFGSPVRFSGPDAAQRAGVATIHQELALVGSMSVAENLLLGAGGASFAWLSRRRERARVEELLSRLALDVDPHAPLERLSLARRQLVEIARAVGGAARILILDEPTSALGEAEVTRLFSLVRQLKASGTSVLYVSHRMNEIYELAERITVLRDGRRVVTARAADLSRDELLSAMLGRKPGRSTAGPARSSFEPLLQVSDLSLPAGSSGAGVSGVSFVVGRGEIVAMTGLAGSGAAELLPALYGALEAGWSGRVELEGRSLSARDPRAALAAGVAFLGADRKKNLIFARSIVENITLSSLGRFTRFGVVRRGLERKAAERSTARLPLSTRALDAEVERLSGGNQQKVALLRLALTGARLLLFDEPTRGVDIGAKQDIYRMVRELAAEGAGVLWLTSELEELFELGDRLLVFARGRLVLDVERAKATRERVLGAAMGRSERS
jgi:ribose transport system ATP-binding protein